MDGSGCRHVPVMLDSVMRLLRCRSGERYIDGTAGAGGYSEAILRAGAPDGLLLALDWDAEALERTRERLAPFGARVALEKAGFAELPEVVERLSWGESDGIVLDLGVSGYQLEDPRRGFSFLHDGPLDMRMDRDLPRTAGDLVNSLPEKELAKLIFEFGEERFSRRIARAIVERRKESPISSTGMLAQLIRQAVPKTRDAARIHPATRTFQALRIAVNRELEALETFLAGALELLKPGGRLCIVSFHSLEDRMVKRKFREWARSCRCPEEAPICTCERKPLARLLTRKAVRPGPEEEEANPRARSGRLRCVEKC